MTPHPHPYPHPLSWDATLPLLTHGSDTIPGRQHGTDQPHSLRICGAELGPEVADEPWVCTRIPHNDIEDHRAMDGSTWRG